MTIRNEFPLVAAITVNDLRSSVDLKGNPSQSYGASPDIWDHTYTTRHRWTHPP